MYNCLSFFYKNEYHGFNILLTKYEFNEIKKLIKWVNGPEGFLVPKNDSLNRNDLKVIVRYLFPDLLVDFDVKKFEIQFSSNFYFFTKKDIDSNYDTEYDKKYIRLLNVYRENKSKLVYRIVFNDFEKLYLEDKTHKHKIKDPFYFESCKVSKRLIDYINHKSRNYNSYDFYLEVFESKDFEYSYNDFVQDLF